MMFKTTWRRAKRSFSATCRYVSTLSTRASRPQVRAGASRLQFKHLTTLFYSSLIATAAAADVKVKRERSEQWDRLIAKAEQDLRGYRTDSIPDESASISLAGENNGSNEDELGKRRALATPLPTERSRGSINSIYATEERKESGQSRWSLKKLLIAEQSVAKLALRLIYSLPEAFSPAKGQGSISDSYLLEEILPELYGMTRIDVGRVVKDVRKALHRSRDREAHDISRLERPHLPRFITHNWGNASTNENLNKSFTQLFQEHSDGKRCLTSTLKQVSQALLTSTLPPDVSCYNILINRLSRLRQYGLAEMAIESFWETHVVPNEVSIDIILNHYIEKNDFSGFHSLVSRIQGKKGGLTLAHPQSRISGVGASRLRVAGDKIVQLPSLDSRVYASIIKGYLRFNRVSTAKIWHSRMIKDGFKTSVRLQTYFLSYSCHSRNWQAGQVAWSKLKESLFRDGAISKYEQEAYYWALHLCKVCQQPQEFRRIYEEGLRRGIAMVSLLSRKVQRGQASSWGEEGNAARQFDQKSGRLWHRLWLMELDLHSWTREVLLARQALSNRACDEVQADFQRDAVAQARELNEYSALFRAMGRGAGRSKRLSKNENNALPAAVDETHDAAEGTLSDEAPSSAASQQNSLGILVPPPSLSPRCETTAPRRSSNVSAFSRPSQIPAGDTNFVHSMSLGAGA